LHRTPTPFRLNGVETAFYLSWDLTAILRISRGLHVDIFTIGFTKKTAEQFFGILKKNGIKRLIDVRLNNVSQLAGFTKREDLQYFLKEICGAEYVHEPLLAPTQEMLDTYKKAKGDWKEYEQKFIKLMTSRKIEERIDPVLFKVPTTLLCSEPTAEHCHRRAIVEYLQTKWTDVSVKHL
jgi:uncharacterized protein (DUF488 family)